MTLNPEILKQQMEMASVAPPKPKREPGILPPGKTTQDMERPPKKKSVKGPIAVGLAATMAFGSIGTHQYLENPESFNPTNITRSITSFPNAVWDKVVEISNPSNWFKKQEVVVPDTFDPNAKKGVIGENNSVRMTPEEYAQIAPPEIEGDNVNLPLFIKFPEGTNPTIRYEVGKGPTGGKRNINPRPNPDNPKEILKEGFVIVNDVLNIGGIPVGSILLSPVDGKIYHSKRPGMSTDGSYPNGAAFSIDSVDENGNSLYITISTVRIKPLIETPQLEESPDKIEELAIPIKAGDPIGVIMTEVNHQFFPGQLHVIASSITKENNKSTGGGAANISISLTPDGKAITLQG